MRKVRIQSQGGLGNQLFIWAMAHELVRNHEVEVRILVPKDRLRRTDREFELDPFLKNCEHPISAKQSYTTGYLFRLNDKIRTYSKYLSSRFEELVGIHTCNSLSEIPTFRKQTPKFLRGFFQNNQLVKDNEFDLVHEFNKTINCVDISRFDYCQKTLHIRRGDTLQIATTWGILSMDYYKQHVLQGETVLICTDSIDSTNTLTSIFPNGRIVTPNEANTIETLALLVRSTVLVMANSSLSWWAGWLKSQSDPASVIFPSPWRPTNHFEERLTLEKCKISKSEFEVTK